MTMTIGEASAQSGVPPKTIRYYEESGLIGRACRQPNRYRTYADEDVAMLRFIGRARRLGFSIEDLKCLIALYRDQSRSSSDVKALASQHLAGVERKIRELHSIRDALAHLIEQCSGDQRPDCPIIDDLSGEETLAGAPARRPRRALRSENGRTATRTAQLR
jgi:MerR family transcriptional regulator, copper efflux regulator